VDRLPLRVGLRLAAEDHDWSAAAGFGARVRHEVLAGVPLAAGPEDHDEPAGPLQGVAAEDRDFFNVQRIGTMHNGGSDALTTSQVY